MWVGHVEGIEGERRVDWNGRERARCEEKQQKDRDCDMMGRRRTATVMAGLCAETRGWTGSVESGERGQDMGNETGGRDVFETRSVKKGMENKSRRHLLKPYSHVIS